MIKQLTILVFFAFPAMGQVLPVTSVRLTDYSPQCKISVLKKLGWQIGENASEARLQSPNICNIGSNKELFSQLKISISASENPAAIIDQAFYSAGTQCSFQNSYNEAALAATKKLKNNFLYIFSPFWASDIITLGTMKKKWQKTECTDGHCFTPLAGKNAEAIDALYSSIFSSDCAVGLQLAEYAAIKELFGSQAFNDRFQSEELFVGNWKGIGKTKSIISGVDSRRILLADGLSYAKSGYQTFVGVTGIVGSEFDESYLDDIPNRNENFMIVKSSQRAADIFIKNNGLPYYKKYLNEVWQLSQKIRPEELQALENIAYSGRLAKVTDISLQNAMPAESGMIVRDEAVLIAHKLSDAFLNETQIYVHPFGPRSIAWHILRLARLNPRTPYSVSFYTDAVHSEIYDRWLESQLDQCQE